MPDYQEMYLHLMRETEKAIRILVATGQAVCVGKTDSAGLGKR